MKRTTIAFLFLLLAGGVWAQEEEAKTYEPVKFPQGYTSQLNVVYTMVGDWEGKMDLYLPPNAKGPTPVMINIHGGGWNHGVKEAQTGFGSFFKQGFAVANIEYRLTPYATAPAAVEDARCALIYIIKNAAALNIDKNRIVIMGGSAGAHLALMAGMLANDHRFDNNCKGVEDVKVAAIISKSAITDVWDWGYGKDIVSKSAINWLGAKAKDEAFAKSVSPVTYVSKNNPPIFMVHGDADPVVPYQQGVLLHNKLEAAGVKTQFITVPGGKHGGFPKENASEISKSIMVFLKEVGVI